MESFDPIAYINEPRWQNVSLGLERIRLLLDRLGNPQDSLRFVHVAGTNGKGSTCAYIESILRCAGLRTGLFTSPYVFHFEERIRVDGASISLNDLRKVTFQVKEVADGMDEHPTEFELMTAVALLHFAQSEVDLVVLEVGLGGRFDSTNCIDAPEVSVITRIGFDHTDILGSTLHEIAGEKAGIIKEGIPVVSWPQEREAFEVIDMRATERGADLQNADFSKLSVEHTPTLQEPFWGFSYREFKTLKTQLLGSYQPANAAVALEAITVLRKRGWDISDKAVVQGIAECVWPGRFEVIAHRPGFIVDGAHNPQGVAALLESLSCVFPDKRPVFLLGVLEDKAYPEIAEMLLPKAAAFVCITPDHPRALSAQKLARTLRWAGQDMLGCSACINPTVARNIEQGVERACELASPDGLVVACGSLYTIGEVKRAVDGRLSNLLL